MKSSGPLAGLFGPKPNLVRICRPFGGDLNLISYGKVKSCFCIKRVYSYVKSFSINITSENIFTSDNILRQLFLTAESKKSVIKKIEEVLEAKETESTLKLVDRPLYDHFKICEIDTHIYI